MSGLTKLCLFLLVLFMYSCSKGPQEIFTIYKNDFENGNLSQISGGVIDSYENAKVLGRYNNGGFIVNLKDLPEHDIVEVSMGLYIHDSWDGNNGPDIWRMIVDNDPIINTTFSNDSCSLGYCLPQSYPNNYLTSNRMGGNGALVTDLPAACPTADNVKKTSFYRIKKTIRHSRATLELKCMDLLKQAVDDPKCDESWSVDDIIIKTVKLSQ